MLTINQLAVRSKLPAHVVRYYAQIGLIQPSQKQGNGYRLFNPTDATRLGFVRLAKQLGFTLNEIKEIFQHAELKESPCQDVRRIIQDRIVENRIKIDEMLQLQDRMESALENWKTMPDSEPDGHSVCHLIESFDSIDHRA